MLRVSNRTPYKRFIYLSVPLLQQFLVSVPRFRDASVGTIRTYMPTLTGNKRIASPKSLYHTPLLSSFIPLLSGIWSAYPDDTQTLLCVQTDIFNYCNPTCYMAEMQGKNVWMCVFFRTLSFFMHIWGAGRFVHLADLLEVFVIQGLTAVLGFGGSLRGQVVVLISESRCGPGKRAAYEGRK